jgi:hypothetical protein
VRSSPFSDVSYSHASYSYASCAHFGSDDEAVALLHGSARDEMLALKACSIRSASRMGRRSDDLSSDRGVIDGAYARRRAPKVSGAFVYPHTTSF